MARVPLAQRPRAGTVSPVTVPRDDSLPEPSIDEGTEGVQPRADDPVSDDRPLLDDSPRADSDPPASVALSAPWLDDPEAWAIVTTPARAVRPGDFCFLAAAHRFVLVAICTHTGSGSAGRVFIDLVDGRTLDVPSDATVTLRRHMARQLR